MEKLPADTIKKALSGDDKSIEMVSDHFMPILRSYANTYFILGGDKDDVLQEGMLGLFFAMRDYREDYGEFEPFAIKCIKYRIFTAIRNANSLKNMPLNSGIELIDTEKDINNDPMETILKKEWHEAFWNIVDTKLSKTESEVVKYYTSGYSYSMIADITGKNEKNIDNALQRARKKLIKELN